MKKITSIILFLFITNCASITGSSVQPVSLSSKDDSGNTIEGAKCTLVNDKGSWEAKTPQFVNISRSAEDLSVECKKTGFPNGLLKAISRAGGDMWGNIIFGGGIGAIIDHNKGTGYGYPDQLVVIMGKTVTLDKKGTSSTK
jgi:hypothetical protein